VNLIRNKKRRRGEVMKSFIKSAAALTFGILAEILSESGSEKLFSIKCLKCERISELEDRFYKRSGDIEVDTANEYTVVNADENFVSIECKKCGNKTYSSEY
jgi:RNase P subunit RPR2